MIRALAVGVLAAAAVGSAVTGAAPAAAAPVDPNALPIVTQQLEQNPKACGSASGTPLGGVPWTDEYLQQDAVTRRASGTGLRIGLLDTGVDAAGAPDLAGRVTSLPPTYGAPAAVHPDCVGHGTAMASLIAGGGPVHGLAQGASIVSVKVTSDSGTTDPANLAAGITRLVGAGVKVIAVGSASVTSSPALAASVRNAVDHGVLIVAVSRFDSQSKNSPIYPAGLPGVLSVSDVGPAGQIPVAKVTGAPVALAAPGDFVIALGAGGHGEATGSGPSYAVAYVAATAALINRYRPGLTPAQLAGRLLTTAAAPPGAAMPDPRVGAGILDPSAALDTELGQAVAVPPGPAPKVRPAPATNTGLHTALAIAGTAGVIVVIAVAVAFSLLARRRRLAGAPL